MTDAERFLADDPPFATPEEFAKVMKERDGEMLDLNAFAREVHENAVQHGWWEEERSFGEIVALCHSELSEALEEYRAGRPMVWYKCDGHVCDLMECDECETRPERADKPEGIAVELADCIIRILDWAGKEGIDMDAILRLKHEYNKSRPYRHGGKVI